MACTAAMVLMIYSGNTLAQTVSFPPVPLTVATAVSSNLLYIHDDSNSMHWSYMPDEIGSVRWLAHSYYSAYGLLSARDTTILFMSPDFNKVYYNPEFKYVPPPAPPGASIVDVDGKPVTDGTLGNAKFTNAWYNGYDIQYRNTASVYGYSSSGNLLPKYDLSTNYIPTDSEWQGMYVQQFAGTNYSVTSKLIESSTTTYYSEFLYNTSPISISGENKYYYYRCPMAAWKNYPTVYVGATNYAVNLCTGHPLLTDEEKQNFANWYSYYRTRMYASKAGIGRAFEKLDPGVRLGWGLINKKNSTSVDGKNITTIMQGVRSFDTNRKRIFLDWLYKIQHGNARNSPYFVSQLSTTESGGSATPLRRALDATGQYYDRSASGSSLGPWANDPTNPGNATTEKAAACRKSFAILMTDGYWNDAAATNTSILNVNVDGTAPYPFKDSYSNTLADVAWYYWNKKLLPDTVANKVPKTPEPGTLGVVPPKYRDGADYPHMTTFTIGLGVTGTIDKDKAFKAINDPSVGTITWPNPASGGSALIDDLLHAAVNGHGDFFSAGNPDEFVQGMSSIINSVNSAQKASSGNMDASTSQTTQVSGDVYLYKTHFKPDDWRGELIAQKMPGKEEAWLASEQMPSPAARKIYTYSNSSTSSGVPFVWAELGSNLQTALKGPGQLLDGQKVLDYIRGSSANEGSNSGQFRPRYRAAANNAPLGDSPHNSPLFVKYGGTARTVFLGANDGMLHAFDATDGTEQFAYIPSALIPKLAELTNGHGFYVDGEVLVTTPAPNKYLLVGALGRGGKGLYGLDVTNPAAFQPQNDVKWELNSPQVCPDSNPNSAFLGNIISSLAYAVINGQPSVILGNGYNSCNDKAALGMVNINSGNATFIKVSDDPGNGLAAPHIQVDSASNTVSAYAGDLRGKMWRFGLIPLLATPQKFFDTGTLDQPITAKPAAATLNTAADVKKTFIYFGTGRYLSISDRGTTAQQNIYGVIEENTSPLSRNNLQPRAFGPVYDLGGVPAKSVSPLPGSADPDKQGWYIPLTDRGERVVSTPIVYHDPRGDVAIFTTVIPPIDGDHCDPRGSGWLYIVNAKTGGALDFAFLDLNGDGIFDEKDMHTAVKIGDVVGGMPGQGKVVNGRFIVCTMDSDNCYDSPTPPQTGATRGGRISWHEIDN